MHQQRLPLDKRGGSRNAVIFLRNLLPGLRIRQLSPHSLNGRVPRHGEDAVLEFSFETVDDRHHDDEDRHADGDSGHRDCRYE